MTVGEKIQFYRKRMELSQEELGEKLLVSRQTVSLWEMGRTLPTIDNLARLREIFSISIDDLLSANEPEEETTKKPYEAYTFRYEKRDLDDVTKWLLLPFLKRAAVFILVCIACLFYIITTNPSDAMIGLASGGLLIVTIVGVATYLAQRKAFRANDDRILASVYCFEIFDGFFVLNVSKDGTVTKTLRVSFEDITKCLNFKNHLVLQGAENSFIIKKEALIPDSAFLMLCSDTPEKTEVKKPAGILKAISALLCVLSILTPTGALAVVTTLSEGTSSITESMWIFFLFLPIPIASILFGLYLNKKGYKQKRNVIVGFIMAVFLSIYGSFTFISADFYSHDEGPILTLEQALDIDIPPHLRIDTQDWTDKEQSESRDHICYTSDIYFDDLAVEEFEHQLSSAPMWLTKIPSDMACITSSLCRLQPSDYYIIYNKDAKELNKLPESDGEYIFINVMYNTDSNTMTLVEYRLEYTKI